MSIEVIVTKTKEQYQQALNIRIKVFVKGQGVSKDFEIDEFEESSKHFLALYQGKPAGVGRLRLKGSYVKFERIATLEEFRGYGIAKQLMTSMTEHALENYPQYLPAMHAQENVVGFYKKLGWMSFGDTFYQANIEHRLMVYFPKDVSKLAGLKLREDAEGREDLKKYITSALG